MMSMHITHGPAPFARAIGALALLSACTSVPASPPPSASTESHLPRNSSGPTGSAARSDEPSPSGTAEVQTVVITDLSFGDPEITVAAGDVMFVNRDEVPHTVTEGQNGAAAPGARVDVLVEAGASASVTFDEPGDYRITCLFHSEMRLLVHVE
jgi:plastocyanin